MIVPLLMIVLVILDQFGYFDLGTGNWIYPVSFVGISLSMVSIAMIWHGMSRRKGIAIVSALIPFAIMTAPTFTDIGGILNILPMVYLGSAVCIQLSGSMMHVMSTSTSVQEREILRAGDAKMASVISNLGRREDEMDFKERALVEKEVGIETYQKALDDLKVELDQRKGQIDQLESEMTKRDLKSREEGQKVSSASLGLNTKEQKLQQKEMEISSQEKELEAITLALGKKEEQLKDMSVKYQQDTTSLKILEKQLKEKHELIEEELHTLKANREALLSEQKQLSSKEKELQLRESSLEMRMRSTDSSKSISGTDVDRLKQWEEKLYSKEKLIFDVESGLSEKKNLANQLMSQAELKLASADERLKSIETKERELLEKETRLDGLEKEIASGREDLAQKIMEIDTLRQEAVEKKSKYNAMIERISNREIELSKKDETLRSQMSSIDSKDTTIKSSLDRLAKERQEIEVRRKELIELDKSVSTKSSQLKMREAELRSHQRLLEEGTPQKAAPPIEYAERMEGPRQRERDFESRETISREKEKTTYRRAYEPPAPSDEEELTAPVRAQGVRPQKMSTGTKRLDDLLNGGISQGSSVLFVGPPFSGKEIGIMAFLADGVRSGIPIVVVTTSKSPADLSRDFAPLIPNLLEAERLGLVRWVDATSGGADASRQQKNYIKVDGPDDFAGIAEAIDKLSYDVKRGEYLYFKLGFLSLSTSISTIDEMESTKFVQTMARSIRELGSVGIFALEKGMHSEHQIESLQHLMDGAFMIKVEKQKTYLSVVGVGEVQTRDWIEFKHTNAALIIGALSLERIR